MASSPPPDPLLKHMLLRYTVYEEHAILLYQRDRSNIFESIVFVIYLCFKIYFPIGYHCTISSIKQNSMLFIYREVVTG